MKFTRTRAPAISRPALFLSGLLLLLGATGCYEQNTRVVVYPDGSGRIVVTRMFSPTAVRMIEAQASMGGMAGNVRTESMFFSEKALKADANHLFGKGVKFVSAQRVDHNGGRGSVALYTFDKIDGLILRPSQLMQASMRSMQMAGQVEEGEGEAVSEDPFAVAEDAMAETPDEDAENPGRHYGGSSDAYRFKFQPGAQAKLTVRVPPALRPQSKPAGEETGDEEEAMYGGMEEEIPDQAREQLMANGNPLQLTGKETNQEIAQKMYKGMRFNLEVEVRGAAATLTASQPDARQAGRCTLVRIDADEILAKSGAKGLQTIQRLMGGSLWGMIGKPGITTENQPEVTFALKPAAAPAK